MTYLAVSILAKDEDSFSLQLKKAHEQGAEVIEIRTDSLDVPSPELTKTLVAAVKKHKLPVIVTCRDKAEGGIQDLNLSERLGILREAVKSGADYIDVELANFKHPDVHSVLKAELEQFPQTKMILSAHNFEGPYPNLNIKYESILNLYPDAIPKIAYQANHINDCFAAFDLIQQADRSVIAVCMGQAGQISRILAKKFGAFLTFACLDDETSAAPGQIPLEQMKKKYHWDRLNAETEIFGLIGNPVAHSIGPEMYNACFEVENVNAIYLPLLLEGDKLEFDMFMQNVTDRTKAGFGGFSVTLPHKTNALDYANQRGDYVDNLAEAIGAVNTIKIGFNGILSAYNTDYSGAMEALIAATGADKRQLHKAKVAVIGAGGVARAVVAGLTDVGARITIYNRTVSKAQSLAKEFRCKAAGMEAINDLDASIIVNCTSLGMHPNEKSCPLPPEVISEDMTVFDTVYNPLETQLLKYAKQAGATVVNGAEMYIYQAMAQYKLFIGNDPKEELVRKIVYDKLALVTVDES